MSSEIGYEPTGNLTLSDGKNHITLPQWTQWVLADIFEHETEPLQAENAKLRELCKDMYDDIVYGCAECFFPKYSEHSGKPSECDNGGCGYRQIADRIRDLGVEI